MESAKDSGRTFGAEVVHRLEQSFQAKRSIFSGFSVSGRAAETKMLERADLISETRVLLAQKKALKAEIDRLKSPRKIEEIEHKAALEARVAQLEAQATEAVARIGVLNVEIEALINDVFFPKAE